MARGGRIVYGDIDPRATKVRSAHSNAGKGGRQASECEPVSGRRTHIHGIIVFGTRAELAYSSFIRPMQGSSHERREGAPRRGPDQADRLAEVGTVSQRAPV